MDSDICNAHVDQDLYMPLPDADSQQQSTLETITMRSRLPSVLQYGPHYDVDHAVPALARGMGQPRYMHVTGN